MVKVKRMRFSTTGDVAAISAEDRSTCEEWLRSVGFSETDERWSVIKTDWKIFLSTTSPPTRGSMPNTDRHQRVAIQEGIWEVMDGLETRFKNWPGAAGATSSKEFSRQEAMATLAERRSFQAIWIGMICFLVYSRKRGKLEEMGLRLKNEQGRRLDNLVRLLTVGRVRRESLHEAVYEVLVSAATDGCRTTIKNNMVLWWMAILVRSAVAREEEEEDYISRGQFTVNILPLDIGLRQRAEALVHYGKALVLDQAVCEWEGEEQCGQETSELKHGDVEWANEEHEPCLG